MVNSPLNKRELFTLAALLFAAFAVRGFLFPMQGLQGDMNTFVSWFGSAAHYGVRPFYSVAGYIDYPPFNVYIFWAFGSLANMLGMNMATMVKVVPNIFDFATTFVIFVFVRKQASSKIALASMALYAFNPAVIYNAAVWGQFDAVYTFFLIASLVFALKSKPELSAAAFAVGLLTKPQAIALASLIAYLIYRKGGLRRLAFSVGAFLATVFAIILPFEWSNPVTFLSNAYFVGYNRYPVTSVNAFNFWGLFGVWAPDANFYVLGWLFFGVSAATTMLILHFRFNKSSDWLAVFTAFMLLFAFFMLPTRMHERYLFPAIGVLVLLFFFVKLSRPLFVALTGTLLVNQVYVLVTSNAAAQAGLSNPNLTGDPVTLSVSAINLVMFFFATALMLKGKGGFVLEKPMGVAAVAAKKNRQTRNFRNN